MQKELNNHDLVTLAALDLCESMAQTSRILNPRVSTDGAKTIITTDYRPKGYNNLKQTSYFHIALLPLSPSKTKQEEKTIGTAVFMIGSTEVSRKDIQVKNTKSKHPKFTL